MRSYNSNVVFIDMLFNLLIGFVTLFILAFLFINPTADEGKIDPVTQLMITMQWDKESLSDVDLWVEGPESTIVGFPSKENGYMVLDRDDLGGKNDTFYVDGVERTVSKNMETVMVNAVVPGEYFINVHFYRDNNMPRREDGEPGRVEDVHVELYDMHPYELSYSGDVTLKEFQEKTVVSFVVNEDGDIVGLNESVRKGVMSRNIRSSTHE